MKNLSGRNRLSIWYVWECVYLEKDHYNVEEGEEIRFASNYVIYERATQRNNDILLVLKSICVFYIICHISLCRKEITHNFDIQKYFIGFDK